MKNLKRCSILKEGNTHYSDSSKPLDKLFDDMDNAKDKFFKDIDKALPKEVTYVSRLEQEITQLKDIVKGYRFENTTLKEEITDLKERIKDDDDLYEIYQDLKQENTTLKKSLSKAGELIEELKDIPLVEFNVHENFQLKEELEKAEDALITSINENTKLKEKLKFKNLPLNKRIEEEYITRRENEDKQKKEVL